MEKKPKLIMNIIGICMLILSSFLFQYLLEIIYNNLNITESFLKDFRYSFNIIFLSSFFIKALFLLELVYFLYKFSCLDKKSNKLIFSGLFIIFLLYLFFNFAISHQVVRYHLYKLENQALLIFFLSGFYFIKYLDINKKGGNEKLKNG